MTVIHREKRRKVVLFLKAMHPDDSVIRSENTYVILEGMDKLQIFHLIWKTCWSRTTITSLYNKVTHMEI